MTWRILGAGGVVAVLAAIWWLGGRDARQSAEIEAARATRETMERINDADPDFTACPWIEWLRGECQR